MCSGAPAGARRSRARHIYRVAVDRLCSNDFLLLYYRQTLKYASFGATAWVYSVFFFCFVTLRDSEHNVPPRRSPGSALPCDSLGSVGSLGSLGS